MQLSLLFLLLFSSAGTPNTTESIEPPAVTDNSLFLSTDYGATWECFGYGLPEGVSTREVTEHEGDLYLTTTRSGLYKLPAGETQWRSANKGLPTDLFTISFAGDGEKLVLGTFEHGVYVSRDGGEHWRKPIFNLKNKTISSLLFNDGVLLAGTDAGIYESYDYGENWRHSGADVWGIRELTLHEGRVIVARQNGMGIFADESVTWSPALTEWAVSQLISEGEYVYAICAKGEVFRSTDGLEWESSIFLNEQQPAKQLGKMMWSGYKAQLPDEAPAGPIRVTSKGWVAGVFSGC